MTRIMLIIKKIPNGKQYLGKKFWIYFMVAWLEAMWWINHMNTVSNIT